MLWKQHNTKYQAYYVQIVLTKSIYALELTVLLQYFSISWLLY